MIKVSEKLTGPGCGQECIRMFELEAKIVALEAERDTLKKMLDDGTTLLVAQNNKMNDMKSRLAEAEKLSIKLALQKGSQVDEIRESRTRLTKVNSLLMDHYPCYDENKCKNCKGDFGEIDYRSCVGYNMLTALRRETGDYVMLEDEGG